MRKPLLIVAVIIFGMVLNSCSNKEVQKPEAPQQSEVKETFPIDNLVDEVKQSPDSVINMLHA